MKSAFLILALLPLFACSQTISDDRESVDLSYAQDSTCSGQWCSQVGEMIKHPENVTTESLDSQFATGVSRWFYGKGLGVTSLNIGTVIVFPPYALYLLGNAGLEIAGYRSMYITDALPEKPRNGVLTVYDTITSIPGHLTSAIAGADYYHPPVKETETVEHN